MVQINKNSINAETQNYIKKLKKKVLITRNTYYVKSFILITIQY